MRYIIVALVGAELALGVVCAGEPPTTQQSALPGQRSADLAQRSLDALRVDVSIAGTVVDEQGQPVKNVRLDISKGWLVDRATRSKYEYECGKSDGTFELRAKDVDSFSVGFFAEGYFPGRVSFSGLDVLPKDWQDRVFRGEKLPKGKVLRENLKIVLEKHGPLAVLEQGGGAFDLYAGGRAKGWSWEEEYPGRRVKIENWRDQAQLPKKGIYFTVPVDSDRKLVMDPGRLAGSFIPRQVRIIMNDDAGGFVLAPVTGNDVKQYRSMKEAPEKGYVREIVLEGDSLRRNRGTNSDPTPPGDYFYFKTSKGYGKGWLCVDETTDPTRASITLTLRFAKTGSRLVATKD